MSQLEPSSLDVKPEKIASTPQKIIEVVIGFVAWYAINGLIWFGMDTNSLYAMVSLMFTLPGNIIVLLICAIVPRLRRVALGILIAVALNLVISLLLGMTFNAYCFVPFFKK